jgi:hypothetical protein
MADKMPICYPFPGASVENGDRSLTLVNASCCESLPLRHTRMTVVEIGYADLSFGNG